MPLQDIDVKDLLRPDGGIASIWSVIKSGSAELEFSQGGRVGGVIVSEDSIIVDIYDAKKAMDIIMQIKPTVISGFSSEKSSTQTTKKEEPGLGELLDMLQDTADSLHDIDKTLVLRFQGKDALRAGSCRTCTTMRILGHNNMEIVSKVLLMRLAKSFFIG